MQNINYLSFEHPSAGQQEKKQAIDAFYQDFGIKQYNSFSGGFRYHQK